MSRTFPRERLSSGLSSSVKGGSCSCGGRRRINFAKYEQQPSPTARQHCHAQGAQGRAGRPRQGMECMSGLTNHVAALLGREA